MDKKTLTAKLGVDGLCKGASTGIKWFASEKTKKLVSYSPVDNQPLGSIQCADAGDYERVMTAAEEAFLKWRAVPAPVRGEIVQMCIRDSCHRACEIDEALFIAHTSLEVSVGRADRRFAGREDALMVAHAGAAAWVADDAARVEEDVEESLFQMCIRDRARSGALR